MSNEATAEAIPADCGHKDWTIGCERCFFEMEGIAKGNIKTSSEEHVVQGAILFNWHMVVVIDNMERQLAPMMRSLDLKRVQLATDLIANLQQLTNYMVRLIADPARLVNALNTAAATAEAVKKRMDGEPVAPEPAPAPRSSIILTDGV